MRYLVFIPAAAMVMGILVGHMQLEMQELPLSAQAIATANGSPDAFATSQAASAPSVSVVEQDGGDGVMVLSSSPAPTETTVATVEDEADSNLPQPSVTVTQALEAQVDVQPPVERKGAGSSPVGSASDLEAAIAAAFPPSEQATAYRVAMCESGGDTTKVGAVGEEGAFQVRPEFWGAVPSDIQGQAEQAAGIVAEAGWSQWSCY